ncbi:hypothetical protein [Paraburkholderia phenoliruptrix]|uniref:hypothetical protein n=1 Tax=Paraburkholderia phenoliruptrix TaxID=252970 RepID=UPI002869ABE7|nr:hypothetical protein [Paraburkholderia phenoliruptrix]WMY11060.1 hypothetical protein P3F88_30845 [Paraburkholderia phenoliruptrix]
MTAERDHEQPKIGTSEWLDAEVHRYLATGDYDGTFAGWPGENFVDVAQRATLRLRTALLEETLRRAEGFGIQVTVPDDLHACIARRAAYPRAGEYIARGPAHT